MLWTILSNPQMGVIKLNNDSEGQINFADFKIIKKKIEIGMYVVNVAI